MAYCPRRTVLDKLLVDAASEAGAEVREASRSRTSSSTTDASSASAATRRAATTVTEHADVVVGADGRYSLVGEGRRHPSSTTSGPPILCGYYAYWSDLPVDGRFEVYVRAERGWAAAPTHDGLTLVVARLAAPTSTTRTSTTSRGTT